MTAVVAAGRKPFVGELLGRSDYAIIGEIVEPGTMVLDLGCGEGELLAWLAENKGIDARGVEMSGAKRRPCGRRCAFSSSRTTPGSTHAQRSPALTSRMRLKYLEVSS